MLNRTCRSSTRDRQRPNRSACAHQQTRSVPPLAFGCNGTFARMSVERQDVVHGAVDLASRHVGQRLARTLGTHSGGTPFGTPPAARGRAFRPAVLAAVARVNAVFAALKMARAEVPIAAASAGTCGRWHAETLPLALPSVNGAAARSCEARPCAPGPVVAHATDYKLLRSRQGARRIRTSLI